MGLLPTFTTKFEFADTGLSQPARALILAPIAADGSGVADTPTKLNSIADAQAFFGTSEGVNAMRRWLSLGIQSKLEFWAAGPDATAYTANTWDLTVATGTATAAGTSYLRMGDSVVPFAVASGDDQDAVAAAIAAAVTASTAPFSASAALNVVTITSDYKGLHLTRVRVSVDLYGDRGEPGTPGISYSVVNNADATGTPTLVTTNLGAQNYLWYLPTFQSTAYLDALKTWLQDRWDTANNYAIALFDHNSSQADFVTFASARNDPHHSFKATADSPEYEVQGAISTLRAVLDEVDERGPGIGAMGTVLPQNRPTLNFDAQTILDAGGTPIRVSGTTVTAVHLIGNRRTDVDLNEDLRFANLGAILRTRELGNRLTAIAEEHKGDAIIADNVPVSPKVARHAVSAAQLRLEYKAVLVEAVFDGLILPGSSTESTLENVGDIITSLEVLTDGGITTGFQVILDPTIVQNVVEIQNLVSLN